MKKRISLFLAVLLLIGMLGGCKKTSDQEQEVSIALAGAPVTIDPQLMADTNAGFVGSFFTAGLFGYNAERELIPVLAESFDVSEDGKTYTFHLKDGLKWSDGRPLTAADFVFGFQRLADPDVGSNSVYLLTDSCTIKNALEVTSGQMPVSELGVSAPDDKTFVVELEIPCPYFTALVTMSNFTPCNEDFYHSAGDDYANSDTTILSCGPYILDRYEPLAMQIHLTKNPYFVDEEDITVTGINLQVVANAQQGLMSYEAGYMDMVMVSGELAELAEGDPELISFSTACMFYLNLNVRTCPALANQNIRMAIQKSIDRDDIVKNLMRTGYGPLERVSPPGYYRQSDGSDFSGDEKQYAEQASYDPGKAGEYWQKGLSDLGVSSITLNLSASSGANSILEAIKSQLEKNLPGLTIELKLLTAKEANSARLKGGYDMLYTGWVADYADPTAFLALFISTESKEGYNNPEYDALYEKIQNTVGVQDSFERDELMHKAEDMLMNDAALIPLYTKGDAYLIRKSVQGFQITPTGVGCILTGLSKEVE